MRIKILHILFLAIFFSHPFTSSSQVNVQDSLALVDFYDSTDGGNWQFVQWDLNTPVSQWDGIHVENNRVTGIELRGACQSGRIPSSFGNLTALKRIYMLDCKLTEQTLPSSFANLVNLTEIKMSAVFWHLPFPEVITKLGNLVHLDLQDNFFTDTIPASIGDLTELTSLDLSNCFTLAGSKLPPSMGNLKKLQTLYANSSNLVGSVPETFKDMTGIRSIYLTGNKLNGTIPAALNNLEFLDELTVDENEFNFGSFEAFEQSITDLNKTYTLLTISPQANLDIQKSDDHLSVQAGGTAGNNTYRWYRTAGGLVDTKTGDSAYLPVVTGDYYVEVTNSIVTDLILKSNIFHFDFLLPENNTTVTENITGTDTTYFNDGFARIASLTPVQGPNALQGEVTASVTIDPEVNTANTQPYVQRHYDIQPTQNAENARAIVTLYFAQSDFDNYNNYVTGNNLNYPLLPSGGIDNGNVRITQFHGSFTASPDPGNYDGGKILITPHVAWNPANNWWVLTFEVDGFSGFFVNTVEGSLPLSLINFYGKAEGNRIVLSWQTSNEQGSKEFSVEYSTDGISFQKIGTTRAQSSPGYNNYRFTHDQPAKGVNFYRLKMTDHDGQYTYSNTVRIKTDAVSLLPEVYPNPVKSYLNIKINGSRSGNALIIITDAAGKQVNSKTISCTPGTTSHVLNVENLVTGIYYLTVIHDGSGPARTPFLKQ